MKRRDFIISAGALAAGAALAPRVAQAAPGVIDWYTSSDQNVLDFWTNTVKPRFEAANPGVSVNLVDGGDNAGLQAIAERALAALGTNADPQADMFEGFDARQPVGAVDKGLWVDIKAAGLSNYGKINPLALELDGMPQNLPYRGSQVLLAYDTTKLAPDAVPKTWADLVAWIKANPGQFIYNRPNKGGSGGNFVRRAIYEANGRDPAVFKVDNYTAEAGGKISGLIVEKEGACSLYSNVDRGMLSGDFTKLGPEVMLSGIALSLTELMLDEGEEDSTNGPDA